MNSSRSPDRKRSLSASMASVSARRRMRGVISSIAVASALLGDSPATAGKASRS